MNCKTDIQYPIPVIPNCSHISQFENKCQQTQVIRFLKLALWLVIIFLTQFSVIKFISFRLFIAIFV